MSAKSQQLHIRLDPVLAHQIAERAKKEKQEKSVIVRDILRAALDGEAKGGDLAEMKADMAEIKNALAGGGQLATTEGLEKINGRLSGLYERLNGAKEGSRISIPHLDAKLEQVLALLRGRGQ